MSDKPDPSRCSVVSVCYLSETIAQEMIASVPPESELIIIDNSPEYSLTLEHLVASRNGIYSHNASNIGFGAACNQGARLCSREFILFLNPDAKLTKGSLEHLIDTLDNHPEAVAANPRILTASQKIQFRYRSALLPRRQWHPKKPPDKTAAAPILHGSALMVRRQSFFDINGFDENIFMYHEDDDLSIRLRQGGGQLLYAPEATAFHLSGHSSPRSASIAFQKAFRMAESRIYCMHKHGMSLGRLSTIASALLQLASPGSLVSHRKRMKAWGFLLGALQAQTNQA